MSWAVQVAAHFNFRKKRYNLYKLDIILHTYSQARCMHNSGPHTPAPESCGQVTLTYKF